MSEESLFEQMVKIMDVLRSEGGCPWDREQTHQTLKPHLIEESYEVIEALEEGNMEMLKEELGDLFLQVLFHSQLAKEEGFFCIDDVIDCLKKKIIRRHPHVFSDTIASSAKEVMSNWEKIKKDEKKERKFTLDGVPKVLPSLIRAHRVQAKAARVGFDFPDKDGAFEKVEEEVAELKEAILKDDNSKKTRTEVEEEFGDVMFSLINMSRFIKVDPDEALRKSINKFISRFNGVEEAILSSGRNIEDVSLEEMDDLWNEQKKKMRGKE